MLWNLASMAHSWWHGIAVPLRNESHSKFWDKMALACITLEGNLGSQLSSLKRFMFWTLTIMCKNSMEKHWHRKPPSVKQSKKSYTSYIINIYIHFNELKRCKPYWLISVIEWDVSESSMVHCFFMYATWFWNKSSDLRLLKCAHYHRRCTFHQHKKSYNEII